MHQKVCKRKGVERECKRVERRARRAREREKMRIFAWGVVPHTHKHTHTHTLLFTQWTINGAIVCMKS